MEIYQIKVFLEVARHLSFTDAADALNLTQPAVSAKIKSLESELETPVFYRLGRKVELTEVGRFLLTEAPKLIQVENQLLQAIEEIKKGKVGNLKIGCTSMIAEGWLPNILFNYRQQHPEIQTQCITFESVESLYRAMSNYQVDIGISDVNFDGLLDINTTCIDTIHYSAFVTSNHPLAKQSWLSLQELKNHPWVILPASSSSRLVFESRLAELGLFLADFPRLETVDTISLMRTYITQGNYLGFASKFDFKLDCQSKTVAAVPLQEFALPGNVYLFISKQLDASSQTNSKIRKATHLNPVQTFIALIQQSRSANDNAPSIRLRSPSFLLRDFNPRKPETLTLSIGVQNRTIPAVTAGLIVQRLGLLEHFLPKDGRYSSTQYQIRWADFSTGAPIVEGLHSGSLDIGILGDYPLLLSAVQPDHLNAQKTRLVSFVSSNPDGSCNAVIVPNQSNLESIEDLRGRVIAVPFNSSAHSMVMRSLQAANLLDNVQLTSLEHSNSDAFEFPIHLADSYAHFAPFHDVACRQGKFRYLSDPRLENLPVFYGVVVRAELADYHPEVVIGYLKALTAAQQWYDRTPDALRLVSQWTQIETDIIAQILSTSYRQSQRGRFFSETAVRLDWLNLHIHQLSQISGNEHLNMIDLNHWIQPEFIQHVHR